MRTETSRQHGGDGTPARPEPRTDGRGIYLTKSIKIPIDAIVEVRRPFYGRGAAVVTDRGMTHVEQGYEAVMEALRQAGEARKEGGEAW